MPGYRLPRGGARIDRTRPLRFTFDGAAVSGFAGDTLASALLASGRTLVARSFKYHRPRGVLFGGLGGAERAGHARPTGADRAEHPRRRSSRPRRPAPSSSQNAWPSLALRLQRGQRLVGAVHRGGLLLQDLHGPDARRVWMFYEPFIRRAAGLGKASSEADPDRYETRTPSATCWSSAAAPPGCRPRSPRAMPGARVILCDESPRLGGSLDLVGRDDRRRRRPPTGSSPHRRALEGLDNVRLLPRITVYGYYDDNVLRRVERVADHEQPGKASRASATGGSRRTRSCSPPGALERPFVFPGNDRPGVMLAGAALAYANALRRRGRATVVVFTNNDSGWRRALCAEHAPACRSAPSSIRAGARRREMAELAENRHGGLPGHAVTPPQGGNALSGHPGRALRRRQRQDLRRSARSEMRRAAMSARLDPAHPSRQPGRRPARNATRRSTPSCRAKPREKWIARRRRSPALFDAPRRIADGARAGAEAAARLAAGTPTALPTVEAGAPPTTRSAPSSRSRRRARPSSTCRTT